jgi:hypothetical protein
MAQTTAQVANACAKVEVSFDSTCTSWTDISGTASSISGTEQARNSGEAYTFDGDSALMAVGKLQPMDLKVVIVYTETDAESYDKIRLQFELAACNAFLCIRWTPRGTGEGYEQIQSTKGVLTSFTYPPIDATNGGPILAGFTLRVAKVTTSTVAS